MTTFPRWYTPVVVLAIVWNALGCFAVFSDLSLTPEQVAAMPQAMQDAYQQRPTWSVIASAVAVLGGLLGSLLLAQKNPRAPVLLWASLVGVVLQDISFALNASSRALMDTLTLLMQGAVLVIALLLLKLGYKVIDWRLAAFDQR